MGGICNKIVEFFFCRHVVVCVGYTAKTLIFHDPYGNLEKGKNNQYGSDKNGAYVEYPKNKYRIGTNWIRYLSEKEDK